MKVSLITVSYNSASTIKDTLQSVANQSYKNIEHILVDGISTDETLTIVKQFQHIHHVVSEKDKGIYDAMNKGIQLATGDIIGIINSDDLYPSSTIIEQIVNEFEKADIDALYGNLLYVDRERPDTTKRKWIAGNYELQSFLYGWMPPHPTFFVKKNIYMEYGLFNLVLGSAADYEIMLRLLYKHQIKATYLKEIIVHMRIGGASNKNLIHRIHANKNDRLAWKFNQIKPYWFTLYLKPLRKITQFIFH
jgi:glycosyltransferase